MPCGPRDLHGQAESQVVSKRYKLKRRVRYRRTRGRQQISLEWGAIVIRHSCPACGRLLQTDDTELCSGCLAEAGERIKQRLRKVFQSARR